MKKLWFILLAVILITSCEKKNIFERHKKTKACPTISSESVPSTVRESFIRKYPATAVQKWFDKGDKGYAAVFIKNSIKSLAEFDNNGNFANEQTGNNQEGDNNKDQEENDDNDCSCNISEDKD